MRILIAVVSAALALVLSPLALPASYAGDDPLTYPTSPDGDPPGANDWSCQPTAERPTPVILVHGTFGDRKHLLERLSLEISNAGFCVFSLDYGNRGTGDIAESARQLKQFTERVLEATGAAQVSMVGHSQGGMMPRHYIKFLGGAAVVDDLVGVAPSNHGTSAPRAAVAASPAAARASSRRPARRSCASSTPATRRRARSATPRSRRRTTRSWCPTRPATSRTGRAPPTSPSRTSAPPTRPSTC